MRVGIPADEHNEHSGQRETRHQPTQERLVILLAVISAENDTGGRQAARYTGDHSIHITVGDLDPGIAGFAIRDGKIVEEHEFPEGYRLATTRATGVLVLGHRILDSYRAKLRPWSFTAYCSKCEIYVVIARSFPVKIDAQSVKRPPVAVVNTVRSIPF